MKEGISWHTVLILIVVITGKKNGKIILPVNSMASAPRPVKWRMNMKRNKKKWSCDECTHSMQETADDVACCNCCKDGSFFEEYKDEYTLADLGNDWW